MLLKLSILRPLSTAISNEFKTVYRYPYIHYVATAQKFKLYHSKITAAAVTSATILGYSGHLSLEVAQSVGICSIVGILPLYIFGHFTQKLVGIVYLNESKNLARISYVDFWGKREDIDISIDEVPAKITVLDGFMNLFYSPGKRRLRRSTFKLCSDNGIVDYGGYNKIFYN